MNRKQAQKIRESFEWFAPCGPAMIAKVMRNLADNEPGVRAMFPEEMEGLNEKLFATLGQIVRNIDRFHKLENALAEMGARCAAEGASAAHYRIVREEILTVMAELAGEDWTEELATLWYEVLYAVSGAMLAGTVERMVQRAA